MNKPKFMSKPAGFPLALLAFGLFLAFSAHADMSQKQLLKKYFWGDLYKNGGKTFYCQKPFKGRKITLKESYIYPTGLIRDYLLCGTPRQCRNESQPYKNITSDLHNIVPAKARFELSRQSAVFEELSDAIPAEECGIRRSFNVIEPRKEIKGDIARAIFYMINTYHLPTMGNMDDLKLWAKQDPPSPEEKARNEKIKQIQGNDNPFISKPEMINEVDF